MVRYVPIRCRFFLCGIWGSNCVRRPRVARMHSTCLPSQCTHSTGVIHQNGIQFWNVFHSFFFLKKRHNSWFFLPFKSISAFFCIQIFKTAPISEFLMDRFFWQWWNFQSKHFSITKVNIIFPRSRISRYSTIYVPQF